MIGTQYLPFTLYQTTNVYFFQVLHNACIENSVEETRQLYQTCLAGHSRVSTCRAFALRSAAEVHYQSRKR